MASDMTDMIPAVSQSSNTAGSDIGATLADMAYDKAGDAKRLKDIYQRIVDARGETRAQFGLRSGIGKPANVSHYLNGKNSLSIESARKFAAYIPCKIEDFSIHWARKAQASGQVAVEDRKPVNYHAATESTIAHAAEPSFSYPSRKSSTTLQVPRLLWGRIDLMSELNCDLVAAGGVEFVDADGQEIGARTKSVDMPDDSMSPRIEQGDRLTLEPGWQPEPGDIVLVRDSSGAHHIRRYKQVRPGHYIAEPQNRTDYESLDSVADGLSVIAVVTARREVLVKRRRQ